METQILNESLGSYLSANPWIIVFLLWVIVWKALALWQIARRDQKIWFVAILIVNTAGLLEIAYLAYYYFHDRKGQQ